MRTVLFLTIIGLWIALLNPLSAQSNEPLTDIQLDSEFHQQLQSLPHLHGPDVTAELFDQKVVIVTFFASWCIPCVKEFQHLSQLHTHFHEHGVEILAVNLFEDFDGLSDQKRLAAFLKRTAPPFPAIKGNDAVSQHFGTVRRIPTLFVFNREGKLVYRFINERQSSENSLNLAALSRIVSPLL